MFQFGLLIVGKSHMRAGLQQSKYNHFRFTLVCVTFCLVADVYVACGAIFQPIQAQVPAGFSLEVATPYVVQDIHRTEMVYIPGGSFQIGVSPDVYYDACLNIMKLGTESSCKRLMEIVGTETGVFEIHTVEVPGFWMDRYEVTSEQYQSCVYDDYSPCKHMELSSWPKLTSSIQQPQVGVTWYDALYFCNMRGARLPTEIEWEYAAKGSVGNIYPWGNSFVEAYIAPFDRTYPVGSIAENVSWSGIYDLSGNAAEWVENRFLPYEETQAWTSSGSVIETSRVVRGGSWLNRAGQLTTFDREYEQAFVADVAIGFRCARSSDPHP